MKRVIDCGLVRFELNKSLLKVPCIISELYGGRRAISYSKNGTKKAIEKLERAIPILKKWVEFMAL